jgi:hypothetical protein
MARSRNKLPCLVALQGVKLVLHGREPQQVVEGCSSRCGQRGGRLPPVRWRCPTVVRQDAIAAGPEGEGRRGQRRSCRGVVDIRVRGVLRRRAEDAGACTGDWTCGGRRGSTRVATRG